MKRKPQRKAAFGRAAAPKLGAVAGLVEAAVCISLVIFFAAFCEEHAEGAAITVDGGQTNQFIDGFGVNANYWSWTNNEIKPVLDGLIDDAGMTLFRVVFNNGWEQTNDNSDPSLMNQSYYDALYSSPEFEKLWGLIGYLNQKGITNGLVLNFQGPGPAWMGGKDLTSGLEEEWAESIVSLLLYARTNRHLQFSLLAPNNEPNISGEGIYVPASSQYVTMLRKLAQKLDAYGLSDIRLVAPDCIGSSTDLFPDMMSDSTIMSKLSHFGMHSYSQGGWEAATVNSLVSQSPFFDRKLWLTEFNVWCEACETGGHGTNDWDYFRETADYLLDDLISGASAGLVWEGYDSFYPHHAAWSFWGLYAVDDPDASPRTYVPRQNFYTLSQISKFVRPGSRMIGVSDTGETLKTAAFYDDNRGQLSLVGINSGGSSITLSGNLLSLPAIAQLDLFYTTSATNLAQGPAIPLTDGTFIATIPADCVFTLTGFDPARLLLSAQLTSPLEGSRYSPPANIFFQATASTSTGAIANVEFFSGPVKLGEKSAAPYSLIWSNVAPGAYLLTARASNTVGNCSTSGPVHVFVPGPLAQIHVSPVNPVTGPNTTLQFSATGMDSFGTAVEPQPNIAWAVNAGGIIDANGLFTSDSSNGGPFTITASNGSIIGGTGVYVSTNSALSGIGYTWHGLDSATSNSPQVESPGINDGDLFDDVPLCPGGALDNANACEGAGVVWAVPQIVRQVLYVNGSWTPDEDGVFAAEFQLQFSDDGTNWSAAGPEWNVSPPYVYNWPLSANTTFTFQGGTNVARGVRCIGRVHTSESTSPPNSWVASATEMQVFNPAVATAQPVLDVAMAGKFVVISWSAPPYAFLLEAVDNLDQSATWSAVPNTTPQAGEHQSVSVVPTGSAQFFRLRRQ